MSKKKPGPLDGVEFMLEDESLLVGYYDEDLCYFLTLLIKAIAPSIDEGATYELVAAMLAEGSTDEIAKYYGEKIRQTHAVKSKERH